MLMNDKIIFDRFYCINSAQTKNKIMVHYILQPHHIFIRVIACYGLTSDSHHKRVLCVVPGNEHK